MKGGIILMVYVLIGFILLMIIAPIIAILPNARQKAQMQKRRDAIADGINVKLAHIVDPDPDPKKYLSGTGKPLERRLSIVAYQIPRQRSLNWRQAPSTDWAVERLYGSENAQARPDVGEDQEGPVPGWQWQGKPDVNLANDLNEFISSNLGKLPDDVVRVEEKKYVISIYWDETDEIHQIIDFLKGCSIVVIQTPTADPPDFGGF